MKRSFTCFILLIYFQFVCAQTGIITYKAQSLMQSETNKEHSNSLKTEVDLMLFTLKYNGSYSFFKKEKNIPINRFQSALATILIKSNIAWYQEIKKSESKFENEIKGESYQVINNDYFNNWKVIIFLLFSNYLFLLTLQVFTVSFLLPNCSLFLIFVVLLLP